MNSNNKIIKSSFEIIENAYKEIAISQKRNKDILKEYNILIEKHENIILNQKLKNNTKKFDCDVLNAAYETFLRIEQPDKGLSADELMKTLLDPTNSKIIEPTNSKLIEQDNIISAMLDNDEYEKYEDEAIKINQSRLIDSDININGNENEDHLKIKNEINDWATNNNIKILSIKSQMDTGKTYATEKILEKHNFKRVLWVIHRQLLSNSIYGRFKQHGFKNYLEDDITEADRVIISVDSIDKLFRTGNTEKFDLIIIDEVESIIKQFNSSTLRFKRKTFEDIEFIIKHCSKVLTLDADYSNRSYDYLNYFGNQRIIINTNTSRSRKFIFTRDNKKFNNKLMNDIKQKKNIAVFGLSANYLLSLQDELNNKGIKTLLHSGKSDDALKKVLNNVNEVWGNYQVLLYSPQIDAGVSFDIEHFDRAYGYIQSDSCTPNAFIQMSGRIRKLKDNNIYVCVEKKIALKTDNKLFTLTDAQSYLEQSHKFKEVEYNRIIENGRFKIIKKFGFYEKILSHNLLDDLNKSSALFMTKLYKICQKKKIGFEIEFIKNIKKIKKVDRLNNKDLYKSINHTIIIDKDLKELINKQKRNEATKEDKITIDLNVFCRSMGVTKLESVKDYTYFDEIYKNYYFNKSVINNFTSLIDSDNIKNSRICPIKGETLDIILNDDRITETKLKISTINEVINGLGFHINDINNKLISKEEFNYNLNNVFDKSYLCQNIKHCRLLFKTRTQDKKATNSRDQLKFLNAYLNTFGLNINIISKRIRDNKKRYCIYKYGIKTINNICDIINNKLLIGQKINDEGNYLKQLLKGQYKYINMIDFKENHKYKYNKVLENIKKNIYMFE